MWHKKNILLFLLDTFFPIAGYMVNRNAFAVLYLAVVAFSVCLYFSAHTSILKRWYIPALFFLMPFFIVFNASRAMMITLGLFMAATILLNVRAHLKKIGWLVLFFALGGAVFGLVYQDKKDQLFVMKGRQLSFMAHLDEALTEEDSPFGAYDPSKISYPGDSMRLTILADAREMIADRPVTGSGLGSMLLFQKQKHGQMINLIDCTPLWLLVETGLVGFLAFAAFYLCAFRSIHTQWKNDTGFSRTLRLGIIASMGCFTVMSLFHEIMYTRFVWVLLGLGLTFKTRHPE